MDRKEAWDRVEEIANSEGFVKNFGEEHDVRGLLYMLPDIAYQDWENPDDAIKKDGVGGFLLAWEKDGRELMVKTNGYGAFEVYHGGAKEIITISQHNAKTRFDELFDWLHDKLPVHAASVEEEVGVEEHEVQDEVEHVEVTEDVEEKGESEEEAS